MPNYEMKTQQSKTIKTASIIIVLSAFSKLLGLVRESALAAYFGAGVQTDAYKVAFELPNFLLSFFIAAVNITFIPVYTGYFKEKSEKIKQYFLNNTTNILSVLCVILTVFACAFSTALVKIYALGFDYGSQKLARNLTLITYPAIIFIALTNLCRNYLQANNRFVVAASIGIPFNLCIILSMMLFGKFGITAVTIGTLLAFASQFAIQLPSVIKTGYRFLPVVNLSEEGIRLILKLSRPILISSIFDQLYTMTYRILGSNLPHGSISSLDYADKVNSLVLNIFIVSIITVVYPKLAYISDCIDQFRQELKKCFNYILIVSIPMTAILFVMRVPVIKVLFERGAFNASDTKLTAAVLGCFAIGIIGTGIREIVSTAFYALKVPKIPITCNSLTVCFNILLNFMLAKKWGVLGLASAISISNILGGVVLIIALTKKIGGFISKDILAALVKSIISSVVAGVVMIVLKKLTAGLNQGANNFIIEFSVLGFAASTGMSAYAGTLYIMKSSELMEVVRLVRSWWSELRVRGRS